MRASILDLRYHMKDVLNALDRNEIVQIVYHGKLKGEIHPCANTPKQNVQDHDFFGMNKNDKTPVEQQMKALRRNRYHDL
jgi:hypothetical protein